MRLILSNDIASISGKVGRGLGYSIQRRGDKFYGVRSSRGNVPKHGHWQFIANCAYVAMTKMYITEIEVTAKELRQAIWEAGYLYGGELLRAKNNKIFGAKYVLEIKHKWGL